MAPQVTVPTNFGRHHLGSATHSNLILNLKDGKKSRANSLILSFNSPVIEGLVSSLEITSLDMHDFQEAAVDCFIDCLYTGEVERMEQGTFREVNKMGNVFNVSWLVAQCVGYFTELVGTMNSESYEEMLFVFDEAAYVFTALKDRGLLELVMGRIGSDRNTKARFIRRYMGNYTSLSINQLDLVIELAGTDVQIIVQSLSSQLTEHLSLHGAVLSENCRHLLDSTELGLCFRNDRLGFENLFDILQGFEDIPNNDLKWLLTLYRKSIKDLSLFAAKPAAVGPLNSKISNLFHSFDRFGKITSFDVLVDTLANDIEVKNLIMFAEALLFWMTENGNVECSPEILQKIVKIKQERGWVTIPKQFFNYIGSTFFKKWRKCEALFVEENETQRICHVLDCHSPNEIIAQQLVTAENLLLFYLGNWDYGIKNCTQEGKCGFILKTTPPTIDNPDLFDIKLCTDHSKYPPEIHLHEDLVRAENMHFILKYNNGAGWKNFPLSWCGKTVRNYREWKWGTLYMDGARCRIRVMLTR